MEERLELLRVTGTKKKLNTFISVFPTNKPNYTLFLMLENPKINKDLIYDYRGVKTKHLTTLLVGIQFMLQAK